MRSNKPRTALRAKRLLAGKTLKDFSQATGRSRMFFSRLETGGFARLTPEIVQRIGEVLGVPATDLFKDRNR